MDGFRIFTGSSEDAIAILMELLAPPKEPTPAEMIQQRIDYRKQTIAVTEATIADLQAKVGKVRERMESDQRMLDRLLDAQAAEEARKASQDINGPRDHVAASKWETAGVARAEQDRVHPPEGGWPPIDEGPTPNE